MSLNVPNQKLYVSAVLRSLKRAKRGTDFDGLYSLYFQLSHELRDDLVDILEDWLEKYER